MHNRLSWKEEYNFSYVGSLRGKAYTCKTVNLMYAKILNSVLFLFQGQLVPEPKTFPSGIKALADYIHGKGLKLGIYSDAG